MQSLIRNVSHNVSLNVCHIVVTYRNEFYCTYSSYCEEIIVSRNHVTHENSKIFYYHEDLIRFCKQSSSLHSTYHPSVSDMHILMCLYFMRRNPTIMIICLSNSCLWKEWWIAFFTLCGRSGTITFSIMCLLCFIKSSWKWKWYPYKHRY